MRGGGAGQGGVGVFWDKNGCLRLPAGVTPAGISLNHPGVNTQVFGLRYREGHTQLTGFFFFFCQVLHSLPHLTHHHSQKGAPLLCDIAGPGRLRAPELPLRYNVTPTHELHWELIVQAWLRARRGAFETTSGDLGREGRNPGELGPGG